MDEPVLPFVRKRGLTGDFVQDFPSAGGLLGGHEDFHLTEGPHVYRHHRSGGFLRERDGDALGLEQSPQDLGLRPTQIADDSDGRLSRRTHRL